MPKRINLIYLAVIGAALSLFDLALPHPHAYAADPISGSILVSLAISAAVTAASVGIEYLVAKNKKVSPVDRGKQDDIRISVPGYGESIPKCWGTFRTAPIWFWHTPIVHTTVTTPGRSGGKGSPRPPTPATIDHVYTTSLAGVFHDGPISSVLRMWFDNDLVYNVSPDLSATKYEAETATVTGGASSIASSACSGGYRVQGIGNGGKVTFTVTAPTATDYDLGIYYTSTSDLTFKVSVNGGGATDVDCLASGNLNVVAIQTLLVSLNSGSNTIEFANAGAACPDLDKIEVAPALVFDPSGIDPRSWTGLVDPDIIPPTDQDRAWPYYNHRPEASATGTYATNLAKYGQPAIRIYTGTETQTADSAIIADKGAANAPAYRGYSYVVIEGLQLQSGRIPNVTIEVDQGTTNVATILGETYDLVGVGSTNRDLTALSGQTITGVMIPSRRSAAEVVNDLQTRFQFDLPEVDGKVKAVLRSGSSELTIPYSELRAHYDGEEMPPFDALITDIDPLLLPARVDVNYLDPEMDYHNNTQSDMRLVGPQYDNQSVSVSLVDSATNMKKLASTLLYKPDREGREFKFTTGPKYMRAHQGTVLTLTLPNSTHVVRVKEALYGLPAGVCEFQAVRQQASLYSPTGTGSISTGFEPPIAPIPANTIGVFIDGPLVEPENAGDSAEAWLYMGMCGRGAGTWTGGFLYREFPADSGNYELVTSSDKPAGIGVASTALSNVDNILVIDDVSLLTVSFYSNRSLESVTEAELAADPKLNLLAVITPSGDVEYVQFATAEAVTASAPYMTKYVLRNLFRGRYDTESNVDVHTTTDQVVVMDSAIKIVPMSTDILNVSRSYLFVSSGQALTDAAVTSFTWQGNALKAHPVTNVRVFQDGSYDLGMEFSGHPRLSEQPEQYAVEIWSSALRSNPADLKRTLPVTIATSQAALLVTQTPSDTEGEKAEIVTSSHMDNNNLLHAVGGISAGSLQGFDGYYMRLDFTFKDSDPITPNLSVDQYAGLYEDGTFDPLASNTANMPCSLRVTQGAGSTTDIEVLNYTTVITTLNYTYAELKAGLRFTILIMGSEYRVYHNYGFGDPPVAVIATASDGPPFPLRGIFEVTTTLDIRDITIGTGPKLKTIYSNREQVEDFGDSPAVFYGRVYQKGKTPRPDGWPVDFVAQTVGGFVFIEGGLDRLLKEGGADRILKE